MEFYRHACVVSELQILEKESLCSLCYWMSLEDLSNAYTIFRKQSISNILSDTSHKQHHNININIYIYIYIYKNICPVYFNPLVATLVFLGRCLFCILLKLNITGGPEASGRYAEGSRKRHVFETQIETFVCNSYCHVGIMVQIFSDYMQICPSRI